VAAGAGIGPAEAEWGRDEVAEQLILTLRRDLRMTHPDTHGGAEQWIDEANSRYHGPGVTRNPQNAKAAEFRALPAHPRFVS
jgi:hypothetical protein